MPFHRLTACLLIVSIALLTACGGKDTDSSVSHSKDGNIDIAISYLPNDAMLVGSISIESLFSSALIKRLEAELDDFETGLKEMEKNSGINPRDIARITVAVISPTEGGQVIIVQTKRDISIEDVNKIKDFRRLEFVKAKEGEVDVYSAKAIPFLFHFPDARTLVVGGSAHMRSLLNSEPNPSEDLQAALEQADFGKTLTAVLSVKNLPEDTRKSMLRDIPKPVQSILGTLISANTMALQVDMKENIDLALVAEFPEVANAEAMNNIIGAMKIMAMANEETPKEVSDMLAKINSEADGTTYRLSGSIDPNDIIAPIKAARERAMKIQTMANARGLIQACVISAQSNDGQYPGNLGNLVTSGFIEPKAILAKGSPLPDDYDSWAKDKKIGWLNGKSAFCYVTGLTHDSDAQKIVLFERLANANNGEIVVAYSDGRAETLKVSKANDVITKQTGRSLEAWSKAPNPGAGGK